MARRKQAKPKAFIVDTPSDVDALPSSARLGSQDENVRIVGSKGLVAAIWEAACRDQAYYEEEQRERGQCKRKRLRSGGKRVTKKAQTLGDDFQPAWFAVESTASVRHSVFMLVSVSMYGDGAEEHAGGAATA